MVTALKKFGDKERERGGLQMPYTGFIPFPPNYRRLKRTL
jgi:hypothetical protein